MKYIYRNKIKSFFLIALLCSGIVFMPFSPIRGQSIDAIQQQIDQTNNQIAGLEASINDLQGKSQLLLTQRNSIIDNEIKINALLNEAMQKENQINALITNFTQLQSKAQNQLNQKEKIKNSEMAKLYEVTQENNMLLFLASKDAQSLLYNFALHESDVASQKNDIAQLSIQIATLQMSLNSEMAEKKVQDQQVVGLQKQKQQLQSQLAIAQSKVSANKSAVSQGQHNLISLQQQYGQLSSEEQSIIIAKTASGISGTNGSFISSSGSNVQSTSGSQSSSQGLPATCAAIQNIPSVTGASSTPGTFSVIVNGKSISNVTGSVIVHPGDINQNATVQGNNHTGCYSGILEFRSDTDMNFVNQTSTENYIEGIGEMPSSWHPEALAAQAVAARTYALNKKHSQESLDNEANHHYDINDTTQYQVYLGFQGGVKFQAARATYAQVLVSNNQIIQAFYSANNGGVERSNSEIWGSAGLSYLPTQSDSNGAVQYNNYTDPLGICPIEFYHSANPTSWGGTNGVINVEGGVGSFNDIAGIAIRLQNGATNKSINPHVDYSTELTSRIGSYVRAGYSFSNGQGGDSLMSASQLYNAVINNNGNADKTSAFIVYGTNPSHNSLQIDPSAFYQAYNLASPGKDYLTAPAWYLINQGANIQVFNFAYGHTIGMSQCGAEGRAAAGQSFQQILGFYYPNTNLIQNAGITQSNPSGCLQMGSSYVNNDGCIRVGIHGYSAGDNAVKENGAFTIINGSSNQQVYSGNAGDIIEVIQN